MADPRFLVLIDLERTGGMALDSLHAQEEDAWLCLGLLRDPDAVNHVAPDFAACLRDDPRFATLAYEAAPESLLARSFEAAVILDRPVALDPRLLTRVGEAVCGRSRAELAVCAPAVEPGAAALPPAPIPKPSLDTDLALACDQFGPVKAIHGARLRGLLAVLDLEEPSWAYGLALRVASSVSRARLHLLEGGLYRLLDDSASASDDRRESERRLAQAVVQRFGRTLALAETEGGGRRLTAAPARWPRVSVIVPTRDRADYLRACVAELLTATDYPDLEILILDNDSREAATHAVFAEVEAIPNVRVIPARMPFNYPEINERGVAEASGEVLLFLNNDISMLHPDWLREMVGHALRPDVGAVGSLLFYPDGRIQHAGVLLGADGGVAGHLGRLCGDGWIDAGPGRAVQEVSAVTAACMAMRREVYEEIGGFDPLLAVGYNDVDLCLRAWRHGYRVLWTPFARLTHHESISRGDDTRPENRSRAAGEFQAMVERWGVWIQADRHYAVGTDKALPGYRRPAPAPASPAPASPASGSAAAG